MRKLLFFSVAVTVVLACAELAWRALVPRSDAERQSADYIASSLRYLRPCAKLEDDGAGGRLLVGQLTGNTGGDFRFPLHKPAGVRRVIFLGESSGVTFGGMALNLLVQSPDGHAWQLMNCAESGSTLEHVELRAAETMRYEPDAVIVVFGHNWMMAPMPLNRRLLEVESVLSKSRLIAGIAHRLFVPTPTAPVKLDAGDRLARLEAFLRHVARAGRERGAAVVLATLTSNLRFPPLVDEDVLFDHDFLDAELDVARGRDGDAIARLEKLASERPHPYWEFELATLLARRGDAARALPHFQRAVDEEDADVDRATSTVNDLIRRVAGEEGVELRDTDRAMREIADAGAPGWDVMRDHCHLQPSYSSDEAQAFLDVATEALGAPPIRPGANPFAADEVVPWMLDGLATVQSQVRDARARRYQRGLSHFIEYRARAAPAQTTAEVAAFMERNVFRTLPLEQRVPVLVAIADGYRFAGLHAEALAVNDRARADVAALAAAAPAAPVALRTTSGSAIVPVPTQTAAGFRYQNLAAVNAWIQLGLLRVGAGDATAAADAFRRALEIAPDRADAAYLLERVRSE